MKSCKILSVRNKTQKLALIVRPVFMIGLLLLQYLSRSATLSIIRACRNVFSANFLSLVLEDPLRRILKGPKLTVTTDHLDMFGKVSFNATLDLADFSQRKFFLYGYPDFMFELLSFCDKKTAFFDIGANIGLISIAVAKRIDSKNIFAFEPVGITYNQLVRNFTSNCPEAKAFRKALSDKSGLLSIGIPSGDSGNASFEIDYIKHRLAIQNLHDTVRTEECEVTSLDEFLDSAGIQLHPPSIRKVAIKIDVEGHEEKVLKGMTQLLGRKDLEIFLVVEVHYKNLFAILDTLSNQGFEPMFDALQLPSGLTEEKFGPARDIIFARASLATKSKHEIGLA